MGLLVLLGRVAGLLVKFVRATFPYAVRLIWAALTALTLTLISTFKGWLPTADLLAKNRTTEFLKSGRLPIRYDKYVYWTFYVLALISLTVGWVIAAYITVFLMNFLFRTIFH